MTCCWASDVSMTTSWPPLVPSSVTRGDVMGASIASVVGASTGVSSRRTTVPTELGSRRRAQPQGQSTAGVGPQDLGHADRGDGLGVDAVRGDPLRSHPADRPVLGRGPKCAQDGPVGHAVGVHAPARHPRCRGPI